MFRLITTIAIAASALFATTSSAYADPVGGPCSKTDRINADSFSVFTIDCHGGEWTQISIAGDGDTDLDLYVYDDRGNLVAYSESMSDVESVLVLPLYRQRLIVKVVNRGSVYNQFTLSAR